MLAAWWCVSGNGPKLAQEAVGLLQAAAAVIILAAHKGMRLDTPCADCLGNTAAAVGVAVWLVLRFWVP